MTQQFIDILNKLRPDILDHPDANLIKDGIIDSLDVMKLITELEKAFDIEVDFDDITLENFSKIDTIWSLVCKCEANKKA